ARPRPSSAPRSRRPPASIDLLWMTARALWMIARAPLTTRPPAPKPACAATASGPRVMQELSMTAARIAKDHLKAFVERIERLEEEKKAIADDIRDVYAEAKANGFDTKALRTIVKLRKQDVEERKEQEAILETYMQALGMLAEAA